MVFKKLLVPALGLFFLGCSNQISKDTLRTGDLLFCSYETGELSEAINKVTKTTEEKNYSHMGIIECLNYEVFVIHASIKRGVVKESIADFLQKDQASTIAVYRLKKTFRSSIPIAIEKANSTVGLPYNYKYLMNDSSYYCSQLVYHIFKNDSLFKLEPMTFKNPGTDKYNKGWVNYYRELGVSIPEGEPGCNPNEMATSDKLIFLGKYKKQTP